MKNVIKKTGYVLAVLVTFVVLTLVFLALSSLKKTQNNDPAKQTTLLTSVRPPKTEELKASLTQKFEITFTSMDQTTPINISLSSAPFKNPEEATAVKVSQKTIGNSMIINTLEPILPLNTYTLTLTQNSQTILKYIYLSSETKPTPIPQNNTALQEFLPHTTQTYSLEYALSRNIYVAHVKYNPNSSLSLTAQIEAVQTDVSQFIQSKGIAVESVKIDYSLK